jgi:hypothetical protein
LWAAPTILIGVILLIISEQQRKAHQRRRDVVATHFLGPYALECFIRETEQQFGIDLTSRLAEYSELERMYGYEHVPQPLLHAIDGGLK